MRKSLDKTSIFRISATVIMAVCLFMISGTMFKDIAAIDTAITPSSVTLYWTAPGDDNNTGTAWVYDIRYSLSPITEENWNQATSVLGEPSPGPAGTHEQFNVTNLASNTTYYFGIKAADESGNWSELSNVEAATTTELGTGTEVPESYELGQNYPNPFNAATRIDYYVPEPAHVKLSVYDLLGRTVDVIVDENKSVGDHYAVWDGLDAGGRNVASGIYFYHLQSGKHKINKKMMLLK